NRRQRVEEEDDQKRQRQDQRGEAQRFGDTFSQLVAFGSSSAGGSAIPRVLFSAIVTDHAVEPASTFGKQRLYSFRPVSATTNGSGGLPAAPVCHSITLRRG